MRRRKIILDAIEKHLRHEPTKVSKNRIKRLRDMEWPQYRLRVGDDRVFFDVEDETVNILAIISKERCETWLRKYGRRPKN